MLDRRNLFFRAGATGLLGLPGAASGASRVSGAPESTGNVAANLGQLRAAPISNVAMIYDGAIFSWIPGDYSKPPLGPADDVTVVKQDAVPLTTGAWVRQSSILSVRIFGAISGPSGTPAANTVAFKRAIAAAATLGLPLHLEGGTYLLDADGAQSGGINFARAGLHIKGDGAILRFGGTGRAFVLDQEGGNGAFLEGMSVEDITIVGGPGVTDGFYSCGVVRSVFRNIAVLDVGGKAFNIRHGVSCHYDSLKYSALQRGRPAPPVFATHGLYIDNNGAGYYTADCVFTNPVMESFPGVGCQVADGSGNLFLAGTFEGCGTGLVISQRSSDNTFVKAWMEANTAADAVISGNNNGFLGPKFMSFSFSGPNVRIAADGKGTWFAGGGYVRHVHMAAGSSGTTFNQVGVDENAGGAIGFQGPGNYTRTNCAKIGATNNVVGAYDDIIGPVQSIGADGTWRPVLTPGGGTITQNAGLTHGTYHRIGKLVFAQCFIHVDSARSPAGGLSIGGLPHVSALRQPGSVHATQLRPSATDPLQVRADPGSATLALSKLSGGVAADMAADIKAGTTLTVSIVYTAAD